MLFTNLQEGRFAKDPAVVRFHGQYFLYYSMRHEDDRFGIGIAVSSDMKTWETVSEVPQNTPCEKNGIAAPGAIVLGGKVHLFYQTYGNGKKDAICHACSADGLTFVKNPENPVFAPPESFCCGRAIDADVILFKGRLLLYFATRDHDFRIQKVGGAWADPFSAFGKKDWHLMAEQSLLVPELNWEGECIEAPATIEHDGRLYMFYGGSYNCTPQQIGCAVSDDGVFFHRISNTPFLPCGAPDAWNSSESGHPYAFRDEDGKAYLFYQGSADMGQTWYLSKAEIAFRNGTPVLL